MRLGPKAKLDRKSADSAIGALLVLVLLVTVTFFATYYTAKAVGSGFASESSGAIQSTVDSTKVLEPEIKGEVAKSVDSNEKENFCRGLKHVELWGDAINWGNDNLVKSAAECCSQCKAQCQPGSECKCNIWVFCEDEKLCTDKYRQCWLKKQDDILKPDVRGFADDVGWTSGIIHGDGMGIIALKSSEGTIKVKLFPDWAPLTTNYIRDVVSLRHCSGCTLYRGEGTGTGWDKNGVRVPGTPPGPPYALLQGTLYAEGIPFKPIPKEAAPIVKRGHLCLIGEGPDFFISLAHHTEWGNAHTVFGEVVGEEDMAIVEKIVSRPTKTSKWGEVEVQEFVEPLAFLPLKADELP